MIANKEKGADKDKSVCDYNEIRRLRYFHGMLLDDKDFRAEQDYHTNKRRFLNRMLHGSGVVCGLDLNGKKEGRWIEITSGLALDCSGNEIWVPRTTRIDLASLLPPKDKGKNQPECEEEDGGAEKLTPYWICIRYDEKPSNPVSVYLPSGSCEERACENSRYKEGYCVELLKNCPEKTGADSSGGLLEAFCKCETDNEFDKNYEPMCGQCGNLVGEELCKCKQLEKFCEQSVPCPECCSDEETCHVVLGKIELDKECRLVSVCINDCRRYVLTGRMLQHMLLGVFAGSEKYFSMEVDGQPIGLPKAGELVHNPIKALCWFLRYQLIEGGSFEMTDCGKKKEKRPGLETPVTEVQPQLVTLRDNYSRSMARIEKLSEDYRLLLQRFDRLEKEKQDTVDKEAPPKPRTPPKG